MTRWLGSTPGSSSRSRPSAGGPATAVGSTRFLALRPEHRSLEIGWTWLAPSAWGTGANTEAKLLQLEHAFEVLGCRRVEFKTDALNERARPALAALPAEFEGIHRKHMLVRDGENRDSAWYSVVDDDWPAVRGRLSGNASADPSGVAQQTSASGSIELPLGSRHDRVPPTDIVHRGPVSRPELEQHTHDRECPGDRQRPGRLGGLRRASPSAGSRSTRTPRTSCFSACPTARSPRSRPSVAPGPWVAHVSGATPLAALAPHYEAVRRASAADVHAPPWPGAARRRLGGGDGRERRGVRGRAPGSRRRSGCGRSRCATRTARPTTQARRSPRTTSSRSGMQPARCSRRQERLRRRSTR